MVEISFSNPITGGTFPLSISCRLSIQYFRIIPLSVAVVARVAEDSPFSFPSLWAVPSTLAMISDTVSGNVFNWSNEKPTPGVANEANIQTGSQVAKPNFI